MIDRDCEKGCEDCHKKPAWQLRVEHGGGDQTFSVRDLGSALSHIEGELDGAEDEKLIRFTLTPTQMSNHEFEDLPEFNGW